MTLLVSIHKGRFNRCLAIRQVAALHLYRYGVMHQYPVRGPPSNPQKGGGAGVLSRKTYLFQPGSASR